MSIRVAILGYGNLGRGMECAVKQNDDMELVAVFTRRDPATVKTLTDVKVYNVDQLLSMQDQIDVLVLCGGSATDLPKQTAEYAKYFNVVDSFDTHAKIPEHFALMGIISVIQVLIKQTADGLGAVIAHIRRLVFYWAWCIHKVRTQLITADILPAWNSALMSLLLFTHIPTPAAISVFTPVWTCMKYTIPASQLMITMPAYFLGNRIR